MIRYEITPSPAEVTQRIATLIATLAQSARLRGAELEASGGPVQPRPPRPHGVGQVVSMADDTAVRGTAMKSAPGDQPGAHLHEHRAG